ncbi:hypothetical protein LIER_17558 [Lithospermum erythrorhizon]|uniref:Integrase catalytic domain-containing protein n=1 Tax=Lithospermum erythrorhizon TaxID=34254 RepID=A0AAV3QD54_LITER
MIANRMFTISSNYEIQNEQTGEKGWTYLLMNKSDTLYHFKTFKALVESESGKHIKCLRIDRGGKYLSGEFNAYCNEHGIKRQLINPYTPQQNGVAERRNRTVMNMVRAFLSAKNMPYVLKLYET